MASDPQPLPAGRTAAFDLLAADTRAGTRVLVACPSRCVRRQYLRGIAKRGGDIEKVSFVIGTSFRDAPCALAKDLRRQFGPRCRVVDVRELGRSGGEGGRQASHHD